MSDPILDEILAGFPRREARRDPVLDDVLAQFPKRDAAGWETVTPVLERQKKSDGTWEYRPKKKGPGLQAVTPVKTPSTLESLGGAAAEAVRGVPSRIKESILSTPEILGTVLDPLIPAGRQGRPRAGLNPRGVYGESGSISRELRESVADERAAARDRLAEAARGLPAPISATLDTGAEVLAIIADPTNFLPFGGAAKVARADDAARAALRNAPETAGTAALRKAMGKVAREAVSSPGASGRALTPALGELRDRSLAIGEKTPVAQAMAHAGSDISPEAISRVARGERYVRVTPGGEVRPLLNDVGAVDARVNPGEVKAVIGADGALRLEGGRPNPAQARALAALRQEPPPRRPSLPEDGPLAVEAPEIDDATRRLLNMRPEAELPPMRTTGTKNAVTAAERATRGLPEVEVEARRTLGATWERAKQVLDEDPDAPRQLAQDVARRPRQLSAEDNALLLHDRMRITNDHRDVLAAEDAAIAAGDTKALATARVRRVALEKAMAVNDEAARKAGYEWGLAGRARQMLIKEDYSPVRLIQRAKVAAAGKAVPREVEERLVAVSRELDGALSRLRVFEEGATARSAERFLAREARKVEAGARRTGRRATSQNLGAEFAGLAGEFRRLSATPRAGLDPDLAAVVYQMAKNRARAGVTSLSQVVDEIHGAVKGAADLTPADVRDAIAEGGPVSQKIPPHVHVFKDLREQAKLLKRIEAAEAGEEIVTKGGAKRRIPPPELAALRERLRTVMTEHNIGPGSGAARLAALKKRLQAKMAELEKVKATGVRPERARRPPPTFDPEAINLQANVVRLRREADAAIRQAGLRNRTGLDKAIDWTVGWGRFLKLSSTRSLLRAPVSAVSRVFLFNPIREVLGAPLTKLPGEAGRLFRERAPVEGGFSGHAIVKSWARFFSKDTRAASWGHLRRMEEDPLNLAHGGNAFMSDTPHDLEKIPRWMNIPGHVNAALEDVPVRYASYELAVRKLEKFQRAMEDQGREIITRGGDLTDPLEQLNAEARAFEWATRQVFMQDDPLVSAFRSKVVARKYGERGAARGAVNVAKGLLESQLPILKVPVNILKERIDYATGLPVGIIRLRDAIKAGIDTLPYEEGDAIARQLKSGTFGLGLAWLGWAAADHLGGYFTGRKAGVDEVGEGEIEIFGIKIPQVWGADHPGLMQMHFFATLRKTHDRYREGGLQRGTAAATLETGRNVPFLDLPYEALDSLRQSREGRDGAQRFVGGYFRGMTLPPDAQRLAKILDQYGDDPEMVDAILQQLGLQRTDHRKRRPDNLLEEYQTGIPGLRDDVR